jgi:hypothetical protein
VVSHTAARDVKYLSTRQRFADFPKGKAFKGCDSERLLLEEKLAARRAD